MTEEELSAGVKAMKRIKKLEEIIDYFNDASADPINNSVISLYFGGHNLSIHEDDYDRIFDTIFASYGQQLKLAKQQFKNL